MDILRKCYFSLNTAIADLNIEKISTKDELVSHIINTLDNKSLPSDSFELIFDIMKNSFSEFLFPPRTWALFIRLICNSDRENTQNLKKSMIIFLREHPELMNLIHKEADFNDIEIISSDNKKVFLSSLYTSHLVNDNSILTNLKNLDANFILIIKYWIENYNPNKSALSPYEIDHLAKFVQNNPYFNKVFGLEIEKSHFKTVEEFLILWRWATKLKLSDEISLTLFEQLIRTPKICLKVFEELSESEPISSLYSMLTSYLINSIITLRDQDDQEGIVQDYSFQDLLYIIRTMTAIDILSCPLSNIEDIRWIITRADALQYLIPFHEVNLTVIQAKVSLYTSENILSLLPNHMKGLILDAKNVSKGFIQKLLIAKDNIEVFFGLNLSNDIYNQHLPLNKLRGLHIYNSEIDSLQILQDSHRLQKLTLSGCNKLDNWEGVSYAPNISHLVIDNCTLFKNLHFLEPMNYLTHLELNRLNLKFDIKVKLQKVKSLKIKECPHLESLAIFPSWKNLKTLSLIDNDNLISIRDIKHMTKLDNLTIQGSYHLKNYSYITNLSNLNTLNLSYSQFDKLEVITSLSNLIQLDIRGCSSLKNLSELSHNPSLSVLCSSMKDTLKKDS